jgi:aminopeptidase N
MEFYDTMSYGINSYPRTGITLRTLERYLGPDTMARVMRVYHQKWRFRHPASQDFFDTVNTVSGRDMNWFFDQFVKGIQTLDYEISNVTTEPVTTRAGIYETDGQKSEVKVEEKETKGAVRDRDRCQETG